MSVLNKLLGMLDELKEENPELANKALLAAETLKAGIDPEELDQDWEEEEEEEYDDSYVIIESDDASKFLAGGESLNEKLKGYGVYMRDHEVRKMLMLEEIENVRSNNENFLQSLRDKYNLDPDSAYTLELDESGTGNLAFVKQ